MTSVGELQNQPADQPGTAAAKPIRVLWLIKGLGPGGAERLLVSTAKVANRAAFHYEAAYLLRSRNRLAADLEALGVETICLDSEGTGGRRWSLRLRRLVQDRGYDVVHAHSPLVAAVARLVLRTLPRSRRPAIVYTEHNSWVSYGARTRLANALTYPLDNAHICVSEHVSTSVWRPMRKRLPSVIQGIPLDELSSPEDRAAFRAELGVEPEDVVIFTAANFRPQKAYPDFLEAAKIVCASEPRVRFLIAGQGPLEQETRALLARMDLGNRVQILGYRTDVLRLMAAADVFALASLYEGGPIVALEALCSGTPVVATSVGHLPQTVIDGVNGFLVPPRRPDLLAARLLDVASDDALRARLASAAPASRERFDIKRSTKTLEDLYTTLVNQKNRKNRKSA